LNVLGRLIALEARQADLLTRICDGALIEREPVDGENDLDHSAAH